MKVFISWSGPLSKKVAEILKPWIKCVLQATEPWISSEDIDKGSQWFNEISNQLADTAVGILVLTPENLNAPWILFEAGALAKGLSSARVCPLLINVETSAVKDPLAKFNLTPNTKEHIFKLAATINKSLGASAIDNDVLRETFEAFWLGFKSKIDDAIKTHKTALLPVRTEREILEEILVLSRSTQANTETLRRTTLILADELREQQMDQGSSNWSGYFVKPRSAELDALAQVFRKALGEAMADYKPRPDSKGDVSTTQGGPAT